jgi:hypothetical protein
VLQVPDDSGFLALVVPATYESFVAEDWDFELLRAHFRRQMARRSLLIWGTGLEGTWRVDVQVGAAYTDGLRAITGPLRVEGGSVLVTSYESLTMAAQFPDVSLPEPFERNNLVPLPDGEYICHVTQMFDPDACDSSGGELPDFVISLSTATQPEAAWSEIPWFTDA